MRIIGMDPNAAPNAWNVGILRCDLAINIVNRIKRFGIDRDAYHPMHSMHCGLRQDALQVGVQVAVSQVGVGIGPASRFHKWALQEILWLGVDATGNLRARARTRSPSDRVWATRLLKIPQGSKTQFVSHSCFSITITSTVSLSTSTKSLGPILLMFYPK